MKIPVYVVTGFLDAGKTSLLNRLLSHRAMRDARMLLLQFEAGEEEFHSRYANREALCFPKRALEQDREHIIGQICDSLQRDPVDEVWVEWNGMTPFSELQALLLHPSLHPLCRLERSVHMVDAGTLDSLLGRTGAALPEQIANCDFAVVRNATTDEQYYRVRQTLRSANPGVRLYDSGQVEHILSRIYAKTMRPVDVFAYGVLLAVVLFLLARFSLGVLEPIFPGMVPDLSRTPLNTILNVFLGILLQAVPFLLIGVLLSSAIQVFLSQQTIERLFPKKVGWGMVAAILGGFCLPVCDCASIPIFRSLVRKGVPISAAVTFMTATPVINPVVMLSTYYAFGGDVKFVAARVGLGILAAVLIGLSYELFPSRAKALAGGFDGLACSCGCYEGMQNVTGWKGKLSLFLRHSQAEFFQVGKYLLIGALVASVFQVTITKALPMDRGTDFAIALLVMMGMAFLLSLCSSSDAVVARSFAVNFPAGAVLGFLVFGPMMDIKNVIMLSGSFPLRFVARLLAVAFVVCFAVVFLFASPALGGG